MWCAFLSSSTAVGVLSASSNLSLFECVDYFFHFAELVPGLKQDSLDDCQITKDRE